MLFPCDSSAIGGCILLCPQVCVTPGVITGERWTYLFIPSGADSVLLIILFYIDVYLLPTHLICSIWAQFVP